MTTEYQPVTIPGRPDIVGQRLVDGSIKYYVHNNGLARRCYVATNGKEPDYMTGVMCANPTCGHYFDEHMFRLGECGVVDTTRTPHHCSCKQFVDPRSPGDPGYVAQGGKDESQRFGFVREFEDDPGEFGEKSDGPYVRYTALSTARQQLTEAQVELTKFREDGAKGKGYSGSSGMVHRIDVLKKQLTEANDARKRTQNWYAGRYGKLHDWARKMLPEPYLTQFFNCVANGLYDVSKDIGETYRCVAGFDVTPGGYFVMDSASEQILHEQSIRAENAEIKLTEVQAEIASLQAQVERLKALVSDKEISAFAWGFPDEVMRRFDLIIAARAAEEGK